MLIVSRIEYCIFCRSIKIYNGGIFFSIFGDSFVNCCLIKGIDVIVNIIIFIMFNLNKIFNCFRIVIGLIFRWFILLVYVSNYYCWDCK